MLCLIADPLCRAGVEVKGGPVLRVRSPGWSISCSHDCSVNRDEEITSAAGGQVVNEFDAYWDILLGNDKRSHIADWMEQTGGLYLN